MSKRIVLTPEEKKNVGKLSGLLTREQLADFLGVSRATLQNMLERDDELHSLYKKGRSKVLAGVAQTLVQKALEGNITAIIFYLKTQAGWREASSQDQDQHHNELPRPSIIEIVSPERQKKA